MGGRERLLAAAGQHFGTKAYSEVPVAPLLAAAEVQAPTLYHHFGDKEGLFVAWSVLAFKQVKTSLDLPQVQNLSDGLTAYANSFFNSVTFDIQQVVKDSQSLERTESREQVFSAYFQAVYEPLCAILLAGMDAGALPTEPVAHLADTFLATLYCHCANAIRNPAEAAINLTHRFLYGHLVRPTA